jgi:hypothetical protein
MDRQNTRKERPIPKGSNQGDKQGLMNALGV